MEASSVGHIDRFTAPSLDGVWLCAAHWGKPGSPLLLLLHGGGANHHWWDHIAPALADCFHVVGLDFRGHGDSDHPEERHVGAFHEDLVALVDHLDAFEVAIVGHSLGAHVALHHAAEHAGVRSVVAIEPSRGAGLRNRRRARLALAARRTYATREEAVSRYRFLPDAPGAPEALRIAIAEHSVGCEPDGRFGFKFDPGWFGLPPREPPPFDALRCPVLILRGEESSLLPRHGADALARELPDARVVDLPGCGHNLHLERPDLVVASIRAHMGV